MGRIRRRAAAVLRFIDTVTQMPVPGSSLHIQVKQKSPVIWKEDGYVVIMEQPGVDRLDIVVSGGSFSEAWFCMDVLRDAPVRICYAPLLPSAGYPFTADMAVLRGDCPPEGMYAARLAGGYRLMEDLEAGGDRIRVWGKETFSPGQLLLLNEGERYEPVTLIETDESSGYGYQLLDRLRGNWKRGKTNIYSAIWIYPDDAGSFCVAYDRIARGGERIRFIRENSILQDTGAVKEAGTGTVRADEGESVPAAETGYARKGEREIPRGDEAGAAREAGAENVRADDTAVCTEVEIQEGQEIEVHVGG